jgi:hypothetical protein
VKTGFQDEAFDLGIEVPARPEPAAPKAGLSWQRYKALKPMHCDTCLQDVHRRWPNGTHAPNLAVYRRKEDGQVTYWCAVHAEPQRQRDGVSRVKTKKKGREV